jgi:hypothetical protein
MRIGRTCETSGDGYLLYARPLRSIPWQRGRPDRRRLEFAPDPRSPHGGEHAVTRALRWAGLILIALMVTACATRPPHYLWEATDRATQEAVAAHMGPPHAVWALTTGETLWTYRPDERLWAYWNGSHAGERTAGVSIVGPGLVLLPGTHCTEYVLRFDRAQVLRAWRRQPCQGFNTDARELALSAKRRLLAPESSR